MDIDFNNKVVIVTGASSGIGEATAIKLAKLSAKLVIVGRNEANLNKVAKECQEIKGDKPLIVKADLNIDEEVKAIIEQTIKKFGKIDVLINNAGFAIQARVRDGIESYDKIMSTNVRSVYLLTGLAAPYLAKTKGNIVNVSSGASVKAITEFTPYCVSKAALDMFTKCVAKDLGPDGVRVNSVNPGPVATNFQKAAGMNEQQIADWHESRTKMSPLRKIATSEDVADLIIFVCSDKASSITGGIYGIDCGFILN